jgi:hypothetical protein
MIDIRIDDPNPLPRFQRLSERAQWAMDRAVALAAQEGAAEMKRELAGQRLAATSLLINSVSAEPVEPAVWKFGPKVEHGWWVYQGRRPGGKMPPPQPIIDWMRVKGLGSDRRSAWAIARKIQQRGIPPRDYVTPVIAFTLQRLQVRAQEELAKLADED